MVVDGEENGKGKKEGLQSLVERKTISLSLSCKTENNIQDNILQVILANPKILKMDHQPEMPDGETIRQHP